MTLTKEQTATIMRLLSGLFETFTGTALTVQPADMYTLLDIYRAAVCYSWAAEDRRIKEEKGLI